MIALTAFLLGGLANAQVGVAGDDQVAAIQENVRSTAPHGVWTKHMERTVLYLHGEQAEPNEAGVYGAIPASELDGWLDYNNPDHLIESGGHDPTVTGDGPLFRTDADYKHVHIGAGADSSASFILKTTPSDGPDAAGLQADMRIYEMLVRAKAICNTSGGGELSPFQAEIYQLDWDGSKWVRSGGDRTSIGMSAISGPSTSTGYETFEGSSTFGAANQETGLFFPEGSKIEVVLSIPSGAANTGNSCDIMFDSSERDDAGSGSASRIEIVADSSRFNTWIERGTFTTALPSAQESAAGARQFEVKVAHANAWPNMNRFTDDRIGLDVQQRGYDSSLLYRDAPPNPNSADLHISNDHQTWMRIRSLNDNSLFFDSRTNNPSTLNFPDMRFGARTIEALEGTSPTHSINLVTYAFQYSQDVPDGRYQAEVYSEELGLTTSPVVSVGLKDFDVNVVGEALHEVNLGQKTIYRLEVANLGGDVEQYTTTPVSVPSNWQVSVRNQLLQVAPGTSAEVVIDVTPPSNLNTGSETKLTFRTAGRAGAEVVAKDTEVTTKIVSGGIPGVSLENNPGERDIFPGQTIDLAGLRIHNKAPFDDTYLFKVGFVGGGSGWTGQTSPASRSVAADSLEDFTLRIKAPASAPQGTELTAKVQAFRIGSTTPAAAMDIPLEVILNRGVLLSSVAPVASDTVPLRNDASSCADQTLEGVIAEVTGSCQTPVPDNDHDRSAAVRIEITNPSPVADRYEIRGWWSQGSDERGSNSCDSSGSPDNFRMNFGGPDEIDGTPHLRGGMLRDSSRANFGTIDVPAETTVYRYLEVGWDGFDTSSNCSNNGVASNDPNYELRFQSVNDPTVVDTIEFAPRIVGSGDATHGVLIEAGPGQAIAGSATQKVDNAYDAARYRFHVVNQANEDDTLTVQLGQSGLPAGWSHRLVPIDDNPSGADCARVNDQRYRCHLGIYDEALFDLVVQPPAGERLNQRVNSKVTVISGDDGSKADDMTFATRTVGRFSFDAVALKDSRNAAAGESVALPFNILNTGTEGDNYEISIISGDAAWKPRLSSQQNVFIPGQNEQTGFVMVTVPDGAQGTTKDFQVRVNSAVLGQRTIDFQVTAIAPGSLTVAGNPSSDLLLTNRGAANTVEVVATASGASGRNVDFNVQSSSLPEGWTVDDTSQQATLVTIDPVTDTARAIVTFQVTPPADALTTSKVPFIVTATTDEATQRSASKDIILRLEDEVGVALAPVGEPSVTILPGNAATIEVDVSNLAFGQDAFLMSTTGVPTGWLATVSPAQVGLGPLESQTVEVTFTAPDDVDAGETATIALFAASTEDTSVVESIALSAVVGFTELNMTLPEARYGAPEEDVSFIVKVGNNGTIPDEVRVAADVLTTSAQDAVVTVSPETVELEPNRTADVRVTVRVPADTSALSDIVVQVQATSLLNPLSSPVTAEQDLVLHVLDYRARDIDGDGLTEFAVDRDRDASNGFEEIREARAPGGKNARPADLERFLSDSSRAAKTASVTVDGQQFDVLQYVIDPDMDGKEDHFLDTTGDGLPNIYWDPDRQVGGASHSMELTIVKDINADAVPDYFVDIDGDQQMDRVFDVRSGTFTKVLVRDINGFPGYAVDANGNGEIDLDETVLYTRDGVLVTILKVDVDGDGKLDDVIDTDGDGRVDVFFRNGEREGRKIVLKDMDGDGILDWTYDSNGDGRSDSYYNPASQTGGHRIDVQESFAGLVKQYWFIPALFGFVLVLFVGLVAVTRR